MAFPIAEKGGPRPLPSLSAKHSEEPKESEGAWGGEMEETEEVEEAGEAKTPGPVTVDMLGFVTADARCGKCEHMSKNGTCAWTRTSVEPEDGCLFGFTERTSELEMDETA